MKLYGAGPAAGWLAAHRSERGSWRMTLDGRYVFEISDSDTGQALRVASILVLDELFASGGEGCTLQWIELAWSKLQSPPAMSTNAPVAASLLVRFVVPPRDAEAFLGDLQEIFVEKIVPEHGERWARIYFWRWALGESVSLLWRRCGAGMLRLVTFGRFPRLG